MSSSTYVLTFMVPFHDPLLVAHCPVAGSHVPDGGRTHEHTRHMKPVVVQAMQRPEDARTLYFRLSGTDASQCNKQVGELRPKRVRYSTQTQTYSSSFVPGPLYRL